MPAPGKDLLFHRLGPCPRALCPARPGALTATPAHRGRVRADGGGGGAGPRPRRPVHLALTLTAGRARWRDTPCPRARAAATPPPPKKPRPPHHRHGNGAWGRSGDTLTYTRRRGRSDPEAVGERPPSRPPSGQWSCPCRNPRRPSRPLSAPPAAAAHPQPSRQHAVRRHFVHWQRWSRAEMASRGPFDISGARAGAGPRGSWQGDTRYRERVVGCHAGLFWAGKVKDGVALGGRVYPGIPQRFPSRRRRFGRRCSHSGQDPGAARPWGLRGAAGAAPGGSRLAMAKHHPDLIFCRKQAGVGESGGWGMRTGGFFAPFPAAGRAGGARVWARSRRRARAAARPGRGRRKRSVRRHLLALSVFCFPFIFLLCRCPAVRYGSSSIWEHLSGCETKVILRVISVIRITRFILVASESAFGQNSENSFTRLEVEVSLPDFCHSLEKQI